MLTISVLINKLLVESKFLQIKYKIYLVEAPMEPPKATKKKLDKISFEEVALLQLFFFLLLGHCPIL